MKKIIISLFMILALFLLGSCQYSDIKIDESSPSTNTSTNENSETDKVTNSGSNEDDSTTSSSQNSNINTDTEASNNTNTQTESSNTNSNITDDIAPENKGGLIFEIKADNTYKVVGYDGEIGSVIIPGEHNGCLVTEIGEYAFDGYGVLAQEVQSNIGFVTIYIPQSVKKISKGAFNNCDDIKPQYDVNNSTKPLSEWLTELEIEEENKHVRDVLEFLRPAIGWNKYVKP